MVKISIIVPVYNAEKYLDKCISSLERQTLSDLELVLVDDGSSDGSPSICDAWAKKDSRILVVHKENGGPQSAVIAGVQVATSEIIGFCDSDDYVAEDYYETLYQAFMENNVDMVCCKFRLVYDGNDSQYCADSKKQIRASAELQEEFWETSGHLLIGNNRYTKLFRKHLLMEVLAELNPELHIGEDAVQVLLYLQRCGDVCCLDDYNGYFYRQVPTSLMNCFDERQIYYTRLFFRELEAVAEKYGHAFATRNRVSDSLMSRLLYQCAASRFGISQKIQINRQILSGIADKQGFADRCFQNVNPVLRSGFRLLLNGHIKTGTIISTIYISVVSRIVGNPMREAGTVRMVNQTSIAKLAE